VISIVAFIKYDVPVFKPFVQGFLALALFYLVMMAGALPNKSKGKIALMSVRKEYSILGFIIATPHALHYFIEYLNGEISIPIFGIIAYVIMIPLFITSFRTVRKRMSNRSWRNLQRFAYLTYTALIIHLILNFTLIINIIVYGCIFSVYIVYKFLKVLKLHQK
jgi:DMSO/TMAO reductase YedYZ heme-binding membrane subunit